MRKRDWRRALGNAFIGIGLLVLLGVGGAWGWEQWQGKQLRAQLRAEPTVQVAHVAAATEMATATNAPTATASPEATGTPAPTEAPTQAPTQAPSPTPAPTATAPAPTAVPGTKPVRLEIPDLKIDVPVADMTWSVVNTANGPQSQWEIPENAAGHAVNSALLGQPDNVVISGHNNIYGRVFMAISQAWPDSGFQKVDAYTDQSDILNGRKVVLLGADGRPYNYVINAFYRVKDSGVPLGQRLANARFMDPTTQAQLTLTTCWPPWSNTHRLIVLAQPASQ